MSTRTIVEINHDYLYNLEQNPMELLGLLLALKSSSSINAALNRGETPEVCVGVRVLGQRHHSETLKVTAK